MNRPDDQRHVAELPSGIIKNPQTKLAGADLFVNDVVYLKENTVYPMYDNSEKMYGVVAANGVPGRLVLIAAR